MKGCVAILVFSFWTLIWAGGSAQAHGVIGKAFIPSTLTLDDPFPSDEMDLLSFNRAPQDRDG
ncbi:MAG: hypothetical protein ACM37Z_13965, partial [Deltaproteobacteria bacterium]